MSRNRSGLRHPSNLTDTEWAIVEPMIPPARHGGRTIGQRARGAKQDFYVLWTRCQWKALPKDLPPKSTVHDYLELWVRLFAEEIIAVAFGPKWSEVVPVFRSLILPYWPLQSSILLGGFSLRWG